MSLSDLLLLSRRDLWRVGIVGALLVAGCLWVSLRFLEPIPPRRIVLASGPPSSLYHQHAERYKELLAREGVTLEERMTDGAGDNLRLLLDRSSGVDLGFVQDAPPGGPSVVMVATGSPAMDSSGEPIHALGAARQADRTRARESGTDAMAVPLLAASNVTPANSTLLRNAGRPGTAYEQRGHLDAMVIVGGLRTPAVYGFLLPGLLAVSPQAKAMRRDRFLTLRKPGRGAIVFVRLLARPDAGEHGGHAGARRTVLGDRHPVAR